MNMPVPFKQIPSNLRVPLFYAELDNSQANTGQQNQRSLIVAQITAAGSATPNVPILLQSVADAEARGGPGSMLHLMAAAYRKNDSFGELWALPLADDPAAVAAVGSINITAPPTANGTLSFYIAGVRIQQAVLTTQTAQQIATALIASINATPNLPVTAAIDGTVNTKVNLTAINKGPVGNDIDLRVNYLGQRGGEVTPTGLTYAIVAMTGGATPPSLTTGFANLGTQAFDFIAFPYTDATSLGAVATLLSDTSGRWSWSSQIYGHAFAAYRGTVGSLQTFGAGLNNQHTTVGGFYDSPSPSWQWAAEMTAAAAVSLRADPGLPLNGLVLAGVLAPPLQSRFQITDQNTLLWSGISTFNVADDGTVSLQKVITTYQKNTSGVADDSYLNVQTMFLLMYVLRALSAVVTTKYSRVKLAADGTRVKPGGGVVTPNIIRGDIIAQYRTLEENGYVQQGDAFKQNVVVQQNATNPNRADVLYPAILIDQLDIFALLMQFRNS